MFSNSAAKFLAIVAALAMGALTAPGGANAADNQLLLSADEAYRKDDLALAEKLYRQILQAKPDDVTATRQLAYINYAQGRFALAYIGLKDALAREPSNLDVKTKFAQMVLATGDRIEARKLASQILQADQKNDEAMILLARTTRDFNDAQAVEGELRSLAPRSNRSYGYYIALSELAVRKNDLASAEDHLLVARDLAPKSAEPYAALGNIYLKRQELQKARDHFATASQLASPRSNLLLSLAEFAIATKQYSEAEAELKRIAQKIPDHLPSRVLIMKLACARGEGDACAENIKLVLSQDATSYDGLVADGIQNMRINPEKAVREFEALSSVYVGDADVQYKAALAHLAYAKISDAVKSGEARGQAEKRLVQALKINPNLKDATLLLAQLYLDRGAAKSAITLLEGFTADNPDSPDAFRLLANAYSKNDETSKAVQTYQKLATDHPTDPQPLFLLGLAVEKQDIDRAYTSYQRSHEISPGYVPALEKLTNLDLAKHDTSKALDRVRGAIEKSQETPELLALLGKAYLAQRDYPSAQAALKRSVDAAPDLGPAYLLLARAFSESGDSASAIATLRIATSKADVKLPALMQLARVYETTSDFDAARLTYESALREAAEYPAALVRLANLQLDVFHQTDAAYAYAKRAYERAPKDPQVLRSYGRASVGRGDYGSGIKLLEEALALSPEDTETLYHLAQARYDIGDRKRAEDAYARLVRSDIPQAISSVARERREVLSSNSASFFAVYLKDHPDDAFALMEIASIQERANDRTAARANFEKLIAAHPQFRPAYRALALNIGDEPADLDRAKSIAAKASEFFPDDEDLIRLNGILSYRKGAYVEATRLLQPLAAKSSEPELLYYYGQSLLATKQWAACKATFEAAGRVDSKFSGRIKSAAAECSRALDRLADEKTRSQPTGAKCSEPTFTLSVGSGGLSAPGCSQ